MSLDKSFEDKIVALAEYLKNKCAFCTETKTEEELSRSSLSISLLLDHYVGSEILIGICGDCLLQRSNELPIFVADPPRTQSLSKEDGVIVPFRLRPNDPA